MLAQTLMTTLARLPLAPLPGPAQEAPADQGLAGALARILGITGEVELWMTVVLAFVFLAAFTAIWLTLLWLPYRIVVALRRHYERGRTAGRELEWLRTRVRDLKQENRELRERLEEYEPTESRSA